MSPTIEKKEWRVTNSNQTCYYKCIMESSLSIFLTIKRQVVVSLKEEDVSGWHACIRIPSMIIRIHNHQATYCIYVHGSSVAKQFPGRLEISKH
jgi:hypothetical protein